MENFVSNPMGTKPIPKLLASLAIPAIIANVVNALYNVVDQIFIGQGVGFLGNAATNIAFPITTICMAIGLMTGLGSAAKFNLELGRRNYGLAKSVAGTAGGFLAISGIVICILIRLFLQKIMIAFGATDQILDYAMEYAGITSFGIPFLLFSIGTNPLVRADGAATYSMVAIITGAVLNTVLDPIFIFVLNMGIAGAAWATVISQVISALILARYFTMFKSVKFEPADFKPKLNLIVVIFVMGITSLIFQISNMLVQVSMNNLLKIYGAASIYGSEIPIASAGIVMKINVIFVALAIGLVQGAQPICGYNYGARKYNRVRETVKILLTATFVISLVCFGAFQIFPKEIISLFGQGNNLYFDFGVKFMRTFLFFTFLNGLQMSATTFFPAIGKPIKGAILSLIKQVIFLLPLLFILPKFFGIAGIMYSAPIADFVAFVVSITLLAYEFKNMPKVDYEFPANEVHERVTH
ncbi:MAG: MATE family efflux transporter [Clostridiales bacterium]|nr:MATE family efflux transporter [Clostridiales bacterium]MDY4059949.1 MATE family efflux transporter [Anaerovoracaceae bacterium]